MVDIAELRGLIAKATPGPWECDGAVLEYEGARFGEVAYVIGKSGQQFPANAENAALIVNAINALPALLDRLEAGEAIVAKWEDWFDRATAGDDCEYLNGAGWSDATAIRKGFA